MFRFIILSFFFQFYCYYCFPLSSTEVVNIDDTLMKLNLSDINFDAINVELNKSLNSTGIIVTTSIPSISSSGPSLTLKCSKNQELKKCGSACPPSCAIPEPQCDNHCIKDVCQCKEGLVVHGNGSCIPPQECSRTAVLKTCKPNSHLASCGSLCAPTCDHPTPTVCTLQCIVDDCVCDDGYLLDLNRNCIKPEECPKKNRICGQNEKFNECGTTCEPTCDEPFPAFCSDKCIKNACQCAEGFVRDSLGKCVLVTECLL